MQQVPEGEAFVTSGAYELLHHGELSPDHPQHPAIYRSRLQSKVRMVLSAPAKCLSIIINEPAYPSAQARQECLL